ncbi:regulator of microtubule dynamics protein 1-like [Dreissena polymorpha]|uniref:regulator of microtubule dynamics protein 1-like n=1 Tax=Dreissena polymorpha TaxID=45954 RepID=UPI0022641921|nr:regulator of microtubule dynamics protein 1-like [Dreissena polymorpha]
MEFSTKSVARSGRQSNASRVFKLMDDMALPTQKVMIGVTENKQQLIPLICGIKKSKTSEKDAHTILLETADRLYYEDKKEELYKLLEKHKDENDDEILWRLARAAVDKGKNTNKEVQKPSCYEGLKYIKRALSINQNNWAVHKSAVMLNPNDAFSFHSLGCWCYAIANLNWYERLFAAAFYTNHPTSTFEEALHWFLLAEKNYPDFSAMNLCMLSMTYLQLGDTTSAIHYFQRCVELPVPYGTPVDKRHAEFRKEDKAIDESDDYQEVPDNTDDDIPLARLAAIFGSSKSTDDYTSIGNNLQVIEDISDNNILQDPPRYGNKCRRYCIIVR